MKANDLKANKLAQLFNLPECKKAIKNCPKDEVIILLSHYSINKPEFKEWDWSELEEYFNCILIVSDYDDLIADPHGIYES